MLFVVLTSVPVFASEDHEAMQFFETSVRPLLAERCFSCHGEEKSKGGLRLDHGSRILAGGDSGPAVVPGDLEASLLIESIRRTDPDFEMPPKEALEPDEVAILERWVQMGAPWPADAEGDAIAAVDERGFTQEDYDWWAVQPVVDPDIPTSGDGWARNPVDRFVARKLDEEKLAPADRASTEELVRRVYFDLHGLPPTPAQVDAFRTAAAEDFDAAWLDLINQLLEHPRYGERWGQHWLDVVRYADSDGYRADGFRPGSWKYRDYVIRSINEDKPYDQFVREQLSADEFAADDPDTLIATAFLRHGIYEWNQRNARMHWELIINEMTNVTGEVFLGLGVGCAQCHDHKFDPILQKDYYALQSFLSTVWWPEDRPLTTPQELAKWEERQAQWELATHEIRFAMDELVKKSFRGAIDGIVRQFPADVQEMYRKPAAERTPYEEQLAQLVQRQVDDVIRKFDGRKKLEKNAEALAQWDALAATLETFAEMKPEPLHMGFVSTDVGTAAAPAGFETRQGRTDVEPAFLTLMDLPQPDIVPTKHTTGRRTALADWIASEENPLSTRVIVNRIWQNHFGRGIVSTPNDFGNLGEAPSHPELLDWLTKRFVEGGWKMKPMHRLLLTSETYLQTARREPGEAESLTDPENRFLWRFSPRRLSAEQIRDAMLAVSGELSGKASGSASSGTSLDRSIYTKKMRNSHDPVLASFDAPANFDSAPTRLETTTPTQSLLMINNDWPLKRAQTFAANFVRGKSEITEAEISQAFEAAWGRSASTAEVAAALDFVQTQMADELPPEPKEDAKYPGETGLRPIDQHFEGVEEISLGEKALWLQPGSRFEQLEIQRPDFLDSSFTVETVAILDSIHADASVNTLVSRWNGNQKEGGWAFGVTSAKSRYQPRNLILQLIGKNVGGSMQYDVAASNLRVPTGKPVYLAAAISADPEGRGTVRFWMKDLSDPDAELQTAEVSHSIVDGLQAETTRFQVGARQNGLQHSWDGQLARLSISSGPLEPSALAIAGGAGERILDWTFEGENGEEPAPDTKWVPKASSSGNRPSPLLAAMTDFCHVLLNSNEFLYVH